MHLAFDKWMLENHPCIHFERYADDVVVHCRSLMQAEFILKKLRERLGRCQLKLHPEKTKIAYYRDSQRSESHPVEKFDFLGYTFRPRSARNEDGIFFVSFSPAVSPKSLKKMRTVLRDNPASFRLTFQGIDELAARVNPVIQGWINYYARYRRSELHSFYDYINTRILRWAMRKYKSLRGRKKRAGQWMRRIAQQEPGLFAHWRVWKWMAV